MTQSIIPCCYCCAVSLLSTPSVPSYKLTFSVVFILHVMCLTLSSQPQSQHRWETKSPNLSFYPQHPSRPFPVRWITTFFSPTNNRPELPLRTNKPEHCIESFFFRQQAILAKNMEHKCGESKSICKYRVWGYLLAS